MLPYRDTWLTRSIILAFFIAVALYAAFEARGILFGPHITITSGTAATTTNFITIVGHADHISTLTVNGGSVPVTEGGDFAVPYLLAPGDNRILFEAQDRYGHDTETTISIYYDVPGGALAASTTPPAATSTRVEATTTATSTP